MKKVAAVLLTSALMLVGAGCSDDSKPNNLITPPANTSTQAPVTTSENTQPVSDFTVSGEATENVGEVKLQWSAPANIDPANKIRLINGSFPGREVSKGAFWQDLNSSTREYLWTGVKSGKRYFRICELKDDVCVNTSNEIEVMVK